MIERSFDRIERLPDWLRPAAWGLALFLALMGANIVRRGGLLVLLVIAIAALFTIPRPAYHLGLVLILLALLLCASALGGLIYGVVGRKIKHVRAVGPYVAGIISVAPYTLSLMPVMRAIEGHAVLGPITRPELVVTGMSTVLFGIMLGFVFLRPGALD